MKTLLFFFFFLSAVSSANEFHLPQISKNTVTLKPDGKNEIRVDEWTAKICSDNLIHADEVTRPLTDLRKSDICETASCSFPTVLTAAGFKTTCKTVITCTLKGCDEAPFVEAKKLRNTETGETESACPPNYVYSQMVERCLLAWHKGAPISPVDPHSFQLKPGTGTAPKTEAE